MKNAFTTLFAAVACMAAAGCYSWSIPSVPRTAKVTADRVLVVDAGNPQEVEAVTTWQTAEVNYEYRLKVLVAFYSQSGNIEKTDWAKNELKNLQNSITVQWEGIPKVVPPEGESVANADERLLVEFTISARKAYMDAANKLIAFYNQTDPGSYKLRRVRNMLDRLDPVFVYMYILDAEIPGPNLKPTEVITAADNLYAQAHKFYEDGKGIARTFITTDYAKERKALELFQQLVREYPTSTKIALSAYYIGEIYKEYFNEDSRAVSWYERAWQWDPTITEPARFQAAVVSDFRLHRRGKAVELYKAVIQHEQFNQSNVSYSHDRIRKLTEQP